MRASEFEREVKRRKAEITRRTNKNRQGNVVLNSKIEEYRKIKILKSDLLDFMSRYYSVVTDFHN